MKKVTLFCAVVMILVGGSSLAQFPEPPRSSGQIWGRSPGPPPVGPLVNLVEAGVDAYNKGDIGHFEKMFADDILWVDEDGHELTSKTFALWFINRQMSARSGPHSLDSAAAELRWILPFIVRLPKSATGFQRRLRSA